MKTGLLEPAGRDRLLKSELRHKRQLKRNIDEIDDHLAGLGIDRNEYTQELV